MLVDVKIGCEVLRLRQDRHGWWDGECAVSRRSYPSVHPRFCSSRRSLAVVYHRTGWEVSRTPFAPSLLGLIARVRIGSGPSGGL